MCNLRRGRGQEGPRRFQCGRGELLHRLVARRTMPEHRDTGRRVPGFGLEDRHAPLDRAAPGCGRSEFHPCWPDPLRRPGGAGKGARLRRPVHARRPAGTVDLQAVRGVRSQGGDGTAGGQTGVRDFNPQCQIPHLKFTIAYLDIPNPRLPPWPRSTKRKPRSTNRPGPSTWACRSTRKSICRAG